MKKPGTAVLLGVWFGAIRLEAIRAVDVVQLIGVGMCFGVALVGIVIMPQTSVGSGSRCRGLSEGLTGFKSRTSRTPAGSPAVLEPKVDSLPLRHAIVWARYF